MTEQYDIVCVGFGPAGLSLAIALHEQQQAKRVLFVERGKTFSWRGDRLSVNGNQMRTNILQDLVTLRDPSSKFTFLNYLHATDHLVGYTNLGYTNPPRELFALYLEWCAAHINELGWVQYGQEVEGVEALYGNGGSGVSHWKVTSRDVASNQKTEVFAKKVILAPGLQPKLPKSLLPLSTTSDSVTHASLFKYRLPHILQKADTSLNIAIVGGDNEAVEIFDHLRDLHQTVNVTMFVPETSLRQTDENAFLGSLNAENESYPFELRNQSQSGNCTNASGSVQQNSLYELYFAQYRQSVGARLRTESRFYVVPGQVLVGATADQSNKVTLELRNIASGAVQETKPFDFVFSATGYQRGRAERLLSTVQTFFDSHDGRFAVDSQYKVAFKKGATSQGAGIWVLGNFDNANPDAFLYLSLRTEKILAPLLEASVEHKDQLQQDAAPERAVL